MLPHEIREFRRMIDAVDAAQRIARRLDGPDAIPARRLPRLGEVGRLPGTGNLGGDRLTYTVRVRTFDSSSDGRNSLMVVIRSDEVLSGAEVRGRAIQAVEQGTAVTRNSYRTANPTIVRHDSVEVVSVYKGDLRVARRV